MALWRQVDGTWQRVGGMPAVAIGEKDRVVAPTEVRGGWAVAAADAGSTRILLWRDGAWTAKEGPAEPPVDLASLGGTVYLVAGTTLWRTAAL
ncbi:hypothetical protein ACFQV2_21665 [Actinokineospora soli]|uniref:Uncharacterized protein n=1 Tax=Actinokineospora soli TaxID=1048753 RepID=A0ABW2TR35_9PSEU